MKNKLKFLSAFALLAVGFANAQVGVGTTTPNASSVLDVSSTTKGLLPPRLTTAQRNAIAAPATGLTIYNTTTNCLNFYTGASWNESCGAPITTSSAMVDGVSRRFLNYNLGATGTQVDPLSYQVANNGALYQWGRNTDGHEVRTSATQTGPVVAPVADKFIINNTAPNDWISPQNDNLWGALKTANDPCPTGFRVPTQAEWGGLFAGGTTSGAPATATKNTWTWTGNGYKVGNSLYLPAAGSRSFGSGVIFNEGTIGYYWSSTTVSGTNKFYLRLDSANVIPASNSQRANGHSVRCIEE